MTIWSSKLANRYVSSLTKNKIDRNLIYDFSKKHTYNPKRLDIIVNSVKEG